MAERRAGGDAAAQTDDGDVAGIGQEQRQVRTSFCVSMSLRFEASVLPSTASVIVPVSRLTDTVAGAPSR